MSLCHPLPPVNSDAAAQVYTWATGAETETLTAELTRLRRDRRGALTRAEFASARLLAQRARIVANELERRRRAA